MSESQAEGHSAPKETKDSGIPFYPLLFAIAPVLSVFGANLSVFSVQDLIRPLVAALMAAALGLLIFSWVTKSWQKGASALLPILAAWWLFEPGHKALSRVVGPASLAVIPIAALVGAWLFAKWNPAPRFLNTASGLLVTLLAGSTAVRLALPPSLPKPEEASAVSISLPPGPRPSIFYIVPDGFGRLDVLREKHGINLDWFAKALQSRGFQIAAQNHSSYLQTQLSLASTLNLQPLDALSDRAGKGDGDRRLYGPLITHSLTALALKEAGYEHVTVGSGYEGIKLGGREVPLEASAPVSLFEASLLKKTPIALLDWLDSVQSIRHRSQVEAAFEALKKLSLPGTKPRFVMAHLLTPHPPFVFDPEGNPLEPKGGFAISDGDDYMRLVAGPEDYRKGYANKVQYTAKKLLEVVDSALAASNGNPPIIIIQGDHGSKLGVSHQSLDKTDLEEGFSNFYALLTPKNMSVEIPQRDTNINTFRRIFSALGAKNLPPLEPKSWYSSFDRPLDFVDVTARIEP